MRKIQSCWEVLEISPTNDKREIKRAYAKKAKIIHPEENQSEFIVLRKAYEAAINYASSGFHEETDITQYRALEPKIHSENIEEKKDEEEIKSKFSFDFIHDENYQTQSSVDYNSIDALIEKLLLPKKDRILADYFIENYYFRGLFLDEESILYLLIKIEAFSDKLLDSEYSEILNLLNLLKEIWKNNPDILIELNRLTNNTKQRKEKNKRRILIALVVTVITITWMGLFAKNNPEEQMRKENESYNSRITKLYGRRYEVNDLSGNNENLVLKFGLSGDLEVTRIFTFGEYEEKVNNEDFNRVLSTPNKVIVQIYLKDTQDNSLKEKTLNLYLTNEKPKIKVLNSSSNIEKDKDINTILELENSADFLIEKKDDEKKNNKGGTKVITQEVIDEEKRKVEYINMISEYHNNPDSPVFKYLTDEEKQKLERDYENLMNGIKNE